MDKRVFWGSFQRSVFISRLPTDVQAHLFAIADVQKLASGQYLHRKGDAFTGIFCLVEGKLKATGVTLEGAEYSLAHVMPGAVIGEIAYLDGGTRTHDAQAISESVLIKFSKSSLDLACQRYPLLYQAIVQLACAHIRQSFAVVDDFLTLSPEQRMAKKLSSMTIHSRQATSVSVGINQQELAAWIGISRQSINKILQKWQRQGWIHIAYRQIQILDFEALRSLYSA